MLAYQRYASDLGAHGYLMSEVTDDRANPNYYGDDYYRYIAEAPRTDWAERARLDAIEAWRDAAGENANMNGLIFPVRKVGG